MNYISILKKPVVSEKSFQASVQNKFVFVVGQQATKKDVSDAFEKLYDVSVRAVNIHTIGRKVRVLGRGGKFMTRRATQKRAIITVEGDASALDITKIKK